MLYGLDIGGTKIELAIFSDDLTLKGSERVATPTHSYKDFIAAIASLIEAADLAFDCRPEVVGIGIPGVINAEGQCFSGNIPCVAGQPLRQDLSERLQREVLIENDNKTFTLSEGHGGAGDNCSVVLGVIIGTGVGCGLMVNGQLLQGHSGIIGEWGHTPLSSTLVERYQLPIRTCGCGGKGCSELYIAGPGLHWLGQHVGGEFTDTRALMDAVRAGDEKANQAFDTYLGCLGGTLAQVIHYYDPKVIVMGGGMSNVPELFERLPDIIAPDLLPNIQVPTLSKPVFGDSSGVRGAALLGKQWLAGGAHA